MGTGDQRWGSGHPGVGSGEDPRVGSGDPVVLTGDPVLGSDAVMGVGCQIQPLRKSQGGWMAWVPRVNVCVESAGGSRTMVQGQRSSSSSNSTNPGN